MLKNEKSWQIPALVLVVGIINFPHVNKTAAFVMGDTSWSFSGDNDDLVPKLKGYNSDSNLIPVELTL